MNNKRCSSNPYHLEGFKGLWALCQEPGMETKYLFVIMSHLHISLRRTDILYYVVSCNPWAWYFSPWIYVFFDFFHQWFLVFSIQVLYIFVRFIPKYFFLNDSITFLILEFMCSLLVYRNTVDFWTFILHPTKLLNLLASSRSF